MKISVPALALLLAPLLAMEAWGSGPALSPMSILKARMAFCCKRIQLWEPTQPGASWRYVEKYVAEYPKTTSIAWVYEQLLPIYMEAMQWDQRDHDRRGLLAADPNDLDSAHDALKAAEAQNDPELMSKYAQLAWDLATRTVQSPKPSDPDDIPDWSKQITFAREVLDYSEYTLATLAAAQKDELKRAEITLALQERNAQSKFLVLTKKVP